MSDPSESKLAFLEELRRIAQWGLGYTTDAYDVERYTRLLELASNEYETLSGVPSNVIQERFMAEIGGNVTPKIGLDAAIFDEHGDLLLIRRHDDKMMALPGGWAELGETPEAGIAREVKEETGLDVEIGELIGHYCRLPGQYNQPHTSYHMIFHATVTGGTLQTTDEAIEIGYYNPTPVTDWHKDMANATRMAVDWWKAQQIYVGVDWCKGGWCTCVLNGDLGEIYVYENIQRLFSALGHASNLFIDIPMGLPSKNVQRKCDSTARSHLPGKKSSVFPVPVRDAVHAPSREEADQINLAQVKTMLSLPARGFRETIREVDDFLYANPIAKTKLVEVHPELIFTVLNNGTPIAEQKAKPAGQEARLDVLSRYWPPARELVHRCRPLYTKGKVATHDVIDAMANAVAFSASNGRFRSICEHAVDERGIPMRICVPEFSETRS